MSYSFLEFAFQNVKIHAPNKPRRNGRAEMFHSDFYQEFFSKKIYSYCIDYCM